MKYFTTGKTLSAVILSAATAFSVNLSAGELENTYIEESSVGVRSVRLEYVAAELGTAEGLAELQRRISIAAEQVCGPMSLHEAGGLQSLMRNRQCYEEASSAAMSQIDVTQTAAIGQ